MLPHVADNLQGHVQFYNRLNSKKQTDSSGMMLTALEACQRTAYVCAM